MEPILALLLALAPFRLSRGQSFQVTPPEPEVAVAMGTSLQINCSMSCDKGVARVNWHGLDTNLGSVQTLPGSSILSVQGMLSDTGTRVCVGSCGSQSFQHSVKILVYAFPDQLVVSPEFLVPGQDQVVSCTAHNIWPADPNSLSFALLWGEQSLEGAQDLEIEQEEEMMQETEGTPLFQVTQHWLLPPLGTPALPALYCQVTMQLPKLVLTHRRKIPVLQSQTSPEPPSTTSAKPYVLTSSCTAKAVSTGLGSVAPPSTPPSPKLSPRTLSSEGPCHPQIHQDPEADWELLCEASCGPGVTVHWTLAPGDLATYHKREAGAQAWLSVLPPGPIPEGWFQCRMDPGGQVTSLYVPGRLIPNPSSIVALWIGSLVLGLLALAFLAYRLWKRYRPGPHPDASSCTLL